MPRRGDIVKLAEREGFEPPLGCPKPDFESGAFDHSAISPDWELYRFIGREGLCASRLRGIRASLARRSSPRFGTVVSQLTNEATASCGLVEPPLGCPKPDFESGAFDHSVISPDLRIIPSAAGERF